MSVSEALNAIKRKDFAAARDLMAREDISTFTVQHFLIKGLAEMALEDWPGVWATFKEATRRFPDYALFWFNRGLAEENLKLIDDAIISQERCLALNPLQAEACGNLSNLYRAKGRYKDAEDMARRALTGAVSKGDALNCLGLALMKQGKFDEARAAFMEAHTEAPRNPDILFNRANLETEVFRFDDAWPLFAAARAIDDKAVFRRDEGLARLLAGDFAAGFKLFEARLDMPNVLRLAPSFPRWKGKSLKGKKLLIVAEQGFGDALHFCRYQEFLPKGDLVWAVPKNLVRLLSGALRGTIADEKGPIPPCDYYLPIASLPVATKKYAAPITKPYLFAPEKPALPQGKHGLKIGLVWAGSKTHLRDGERSVPLKAFEPVFKNVKADFYAPFTDAGDVGAYPIAKLESLISDFADTAALLKQLDCLITVDTAAAHLAGALGVKTFLLLPFCPDWRWGIKGETTDLYPSLTLLRQETPADWKTVIDKLLSKLNPGQPA